MHRFFVDRRSLSDNTVRISGEDSRHICRVLRLHEGDMIRLCDGEGMDYEGVIEKIYENSVVVAVKRSFPSSSEPQTKVVLYQAVPKGTKMDIIIQKCVELGVYRIVPVITARTIVKLESEKDANKTARWQRIARKQQGRAGEELYHKYQCHWPLIMPYKAALICFVYFPVKMKGSW